MRRTTLAAAPLWILCLAPSCAPGAEASLSSSSADEWHARALEASLAGDPAAREEALDAALAADPDHAPARAERGEVAAEGRWVTAEYAQHLAAEDTNRAEYERRRRGAGDSPADQARLARWCDRVRLGPEARPHWLAVLAADPDNAEALAAIDAVWRDGRLVAEDLAAERDAEGKKRALTARQWERRFVRFEGRARVDEDELEAITSDLNPAAIGPLEDRIARLGSAPGVQGAAAVAAAGPRASEGTRLLVEAFFDRAPEWPDVEVTALLCRAAVLAGEPYRGRSVELLRDRPRDDVMPMLLSYLVAPIESAHQVTRDRQGNVLYSHRVTSEGPERDRVHEASHLTRVEVNRSDLRPAGFASFTTDASIYEAMISARFEGLRAHLEYEAQAAETDLRVAEHNAAAEQVNRRVIDALGEVSGRSLGDEPREWWDYWRRHTGYDNYTRPVERTYESSSRTRSVTATPTLVRLPPPPPRPRCECFVAGTPVWTREGKRPIESLRAGELVLARDPHRGGLVWRVVTGTTVRDPSPMVSVTADDETIHATEGHPFWVVGRGWRMAKELAEGDLLVALKGPARVTAVAGRASERAYNLIVEGAANYHVGERGALVHDNTPRVPAVGLVAQR